MNTYRFPGSVSLSFRGLVHASPRNRTFSPLSCGPSLPNSFSRLPGKYLPRFNMMSLQRSLSLSGASSSKTIAAVAPTIAENHSEEDDVLAELRSLLPSADAIPTVPQPPWMQELLRSGSSRHSRASSIVSTRTRFSTTTIDDANADARSIDLHVGGQYFRISRDGSRITDELPPPYSGPASAFRLSSPDPLASRSSSISIFRGGRARGSSLFDAAYGEEDDQTDGNLTAFERSPVNVRANILGPSEVDIPSPVDGNAGRNEQPTEDLAADGDTPERYPSYKAGPEVISVPQEARKQRTMSENLNFPSLNSSVARFGSPLKRRNGIRLPSIVTDSLNERVATSSSQVPVTQVRRASTSPVGVRSAGPVLMTSHDMEIPESPTFIGRNADALFPRPGRLSREGLIHNVFESSTKAIPGLSCPDSSDDHINPPAMDSENDISLHYARLMRRLDRDHRKALHLKDKELEKLRERLNEVDTVYRQELRARDFMVDDLKKRLSHLQETQETRIEKARNEVEDLWENRWQDKHFHMRERMRRIEEEAQRSLGNSSTLGVYEYA